MAHVLHVSASPGGEDSRSLALADAFLDAWRQAHPADTHETADVWNLELPEFDASMIAAKFAVLRAQDAAAEQEAQWDRAVRVSRQFNRADVYVFSLPMWNYGLPYRLKHYIDIVTLPGQNWRWSRDEGYQPLLSGKRAFLMYSSAGDFSEGATPQYQDFQKPYMHQWLRFLGIEVAGEVALAPTLTNPDKLMRIRADAIARARSLAARS
ncbi:NAD(P)H-dependent oxidoreductase [Pseudoxanthomonas sp. z9]|uniref:FMN-dependent NADH-azoreductase n=1 Tax=Pseudoxanthomonas sp. z9 TaxID=2584942 RepID=UPI001144C0CE|nr:NAD(P)H-dependent oxidoreductase [Pseudoxanthomonas sp. z9]